MINSSDGQKHYTTLCSGLIKVHDRRMTHWPTPTWTLLKNNETLITGKQMFIENIFQMSTRQHYEQVLENIFWTGNEWVEILSYHYYYY